MKNFLIKFFKTDLFRASFLNGIANIIKILTSLVSNKIVAVYLGPSGIALLGQFQNFSSIVMNLANFGINNGITKYIAENNNNEVKRKEIITTGFYIIVLGSIIGSIYIYFQRYYFAASLLKNVEYSYVFVLFSLTLILFALNSLLLSIVNGYKEFKKFVIINISSSFISLIITVIFIIEYGLVGAFVAWILTQSLILFVSLFWIRKLEWLSIENFTKHFNKALITKLAKFSVMTLTSILTIVFVQLQIRSYLISNFSMQEAGYWQGIVRICEIYISFVTTTLGIYYLPKLSELQTNKALKHEIFQAYKFIIPLLLISSGLILLLKNFIIQLLFSNEFIEMKDLFLFQILGNIFKVSSFILSFLMVAKAMWVEYIISEIGSSVLYYLLILYFVNKFGVVGATYAYCCVYFLYLLFVISLFRKTLFSK